MNQALIMEVIRSRFRALIAAAILLLLNIGLYAYLASFQEPKLVALQERMVSSRVAGGAQDTGTIYRQGKADLVVWDERIPPKKEFARFLGDLFAMAKSNSLSLGGITYRPSISKEEPLLAYSITFNVAGKYAEVKSFIADVSHLQSILVIENISLNNSRLTEEYVDLKLELTAYFRLGAQ